MNTTDHWQTCQNPARRSLPRDLGESLCKDGAESRSDSWCTRTWEGYRVYRREPVRHRRVDWRGRQSWEDNGRHVGFFQPANGFQPSTRGPATSLQEPVDQAKDENEQGAR